MKNYIMGKTLVEIDSLPSETIDVLGFKSEEEMEEAILKLIQLRPELVDNND